MLENVRLCPRFESAFQILGKRWNGLIIRILAERPLRFGELDQAIPDLSARMLAARLKELEKEGLILRSVYPEMPIRIEYSLSGKGSELEKALDAVQLWADKWKQTP
ncbi:MAG: transcriptional regulator [Erysipelotrichales bacterium]|nr:MAG: transcriptional regulator [Erysipelotrichales bacterium]